MSVRTRDRILVLRLWPGRARARDAALAEALALLRDLDATSLPGGPLSEQRGVVWVGVPSAALDEAAARLPRLGYTASVSVLVPAGEAEPRDEPVRWRRRAHALRRLTEVDAGQLRDRAPDRRSFLLVCADGVVRRVPGYRGGRDPLSHRALPAFDARLMVNLVHGPEPGAGRLLDPFAGAGGIIAEAADSGWTAMSADVDPALRYGLAELASGHVVADARALPFATGAFDAIATEPPYHPSAAAAVEASMTELRRVLRPGGRLAMLVATGQRAALVGRAVALGLSHVLDAPVDRKGTPVAALLWERRPAGTGEPRGGGDQGGPATAPAASRSRRSAPAIGE